MAIALDVMDLVNYPGTTKRVTIDTQTLVPVGVDGDEKYMLSASTSAYSDNGVRTPIQSLYVAGGKIGWSKSSGLKGTNGKFALSPSNTVLGVKMDATVSGTVGGFYYITLSNDNGVGKKGEDIAVDIQDRLRLIECNDVDAGFQLAYKNCSVRYMDNKFFIASGTIADSFTGPYRSSVLVGGTPPNDCAAMLGFDQQVTSERLEDVFILEAPITSNYTAGTTSLSVNLLTGVSVGDALCITDGVNIDYFIASNFTTGTVTVSSDPVLGIANNYTVASGAYIQVLKKSDPDNRVDSFHRDTDELLRYMAKVMINQIDFS